MLKLVVVIFIAIGATCRAEPPNFNLRSYLLDASVKYFKSSQNYNSSGNFSDLTGDNYFSDTKVRVLGRHDFSAKYSAFGAINVVSAKSVDPDFERSRTTLPEVSGGLDYLFYDEFVRIIPEAEIVIPLIPYSSSSDEAMVSDGVWQIKAGAFLDKNWKKMNAYLYSGISFRSHGRSMLLPYELALLYRFSAVFAGIKIKGFRSITDDQDTSNPEERNEVNARLNGGSLRYNAINPSLTELEAELGYEFSHSFSLRAGYSMPLIGENVARGNMIGVSISVNWGDYYTPKYQRPLGNRLYEKEKKNIGGKDNSFVIETYGDEDDSDANSIELVPKGEITIVEEKQKRTKAPKADVLMQVRKKNGPTGTKSKKKQKK